jgi:hypothetical protein
VVGFTTGSRGEVPGKRKHLIREQHNNNNNNNNDDDDDDNDNNNNNNAGLTGSRYDFPDELSYSMKGEESRD